MSIKNYKQAMDECIRLKDKSKHPETIKFVKNAIGIREGALNDEALARWDTSNEEANQFIRDRTKAMNQLIELIKMDMRLHRPVR